VSGQVVALDSLFTGNRALTDFGGGVYLFSKRGRSLPEILSPATVPLSPAARSSWRLLSPPNSRLFTNLTFENNSTPAGPDCAGSDCPAI
jgi:hypothetical protein